MKHSIAIIGAGPSGLFAAEVLSSAGLEVHIYERKPSVARKFLMAGRGGLNITHSEDLSLFTFRYGNEEPIIKPFLQQFTPEDMRQWCHDLGEETFIGSSGRVFPKSMKASPLLRAWLKRLEALDVTFHLRHKWVGWDDHKNIIFEKDDGEVIKTKTTCTLLSMGGASWPSLGSDGTWADILKNKGVLVTPFAPSNCGFNIQWSPYIKNKFSGTPLKGISLSFGKHTTHGEVVITKNGIEGGAIYALSSHIRKEIEKNGFADLFFDLRPNISTQDLALKLSKPRGRLSFSTWLQKCLRLSPLSIALLRETYPEIPVKDNIDIAKAIKSIPLKTTSSFSIEKAISSAGGLKFSEVDENLMIKSMDGVFACGEMLDWEAPTGGYLLQASFATGKAAAVGILNWLNTSKMA